MTIADDIAAGPTTVRGQGDRRCKVGQTLDRLTAGDRAAILDALHGDEWTDDHLSRYLHGKGMGASSSLLCRHRTRTCICDDPEKP